MSALDGFVNDSELRVFGLQRSGIHAIVNWIVQQSAGPTLFINDIRGLADNPFVKASDFHWHRRDDDPAEDLNVAAERVGTHAPKDYLILGYEDTDLRRVPVGMDELLAEAVGPSRTRKNVLIVRDAFNLFASRLGFFNSANRHPMTTHGRHVRELWMRHARECLGHTHYLGKETVMVKYNAWFVDPQYRRSIAHSLGLTFTDRGLDEVPGVDLPHSEFPRFGCGSSFDNQKFHGRAQTMAVLERWKRYAEDPGYLKLIDDSELVELSNELFGPIAGVEAITL